ncbi:hypothetical protein POM88_016452 [Heracleum sosnowskyi]|uniref:TF-B3 domain-containing protein n=1 Tax=Heracleum sosnowskyi TaxID=360622 RepID=A0AAD8INL1_9APIA|nr:hypothetical protein POM88_016452 [Heracleum sosnowskyi]
MVLHTHVKIGNEGMFDCEVPLNYSISEENDGALFFSNVSWSDFSFFRVVIQSIHLDQEYDKVPIWQEMREIFKNWNDGERITLWLFNRCWEIEIEWCNYNCMFGVGWSKFIKEAEICVGDSCIFECTCDRLEFNICIERHQDQDFSSVNPGDVDFIIFLDNSGDVEFSLNVRPNTQYIIKYV